MARSIGISERLLPYLVGRPGSLVTARWLSVRLSRSPCVGQEYWWPRDGSSCFGCSWGYYSQRGVAYNPPWRPLHRPDFCICRACPI